MTRDPLHGDHLPGSAWRKLFWDLGAPIIWITDRKGYLIVSEGGGLRSIGKWYSDNVGMHLSEFGLESRVWRDAYPAALRGETSITPSVFANTTYLNLCGPVHDGRGTVSGMFGFSWQVDAASFEQLQSAVLDIGKSLGVQDAT